MIGDGSIEHLGLVYDGPDDFVAAVVPSVRRALDRGDAVCLMVDRSVGRRLRHELGDGADAVWFPAPPELFQPDEQPFLDHLRTLGGMDGRSLVIGQYTAFAVDDDACRAAEASINLVLCDLPVTLICACGRDAGARMLTTARRSHPYLVHGDVPIPNPDYLPPPDRTAVPDRVLGAPAVRVGFRDSRDLLRLRELVTGVARDAGMEGDDLRSAVLAVHEAAVLACPPTLDPGNTDPGNTDPGNTDPGNTEAADTDGRSDADIERLLEVRRFPSTLLSEVTGPRAYGAADTASGSADPVRHIRPWCDDVVVHDGTSTRSVRLRTDVPRRRLGDPGA